MFWQQTYADVTFSGSSMGYQVAHRTIATSRRSVPHRLLASERKSRLTVGSFFRLQFFPCVVEPILV
jgi:hypothetical protein